MSTSIQDLEREILNLEQQKINIQIKIWNAKDNLLKAQTSQDRKSDNDIDPIVSGSSSQGQKQTTNTAQSDVRLTQASSQGQEKNNSRPADSHSTPQQRNVSHLGSVEPGSVDSHNTRVDNRGMPTNNAQPGQAFSNINNPESSTLSPRKELPSPGKPVPLTPEQMAQVQLKAQYARIGMVLPPSRPSTAMANLRSHLDNIRSQHMPSPPIHPPSPQREAAPSSQEASLLQQRQITSQTSGQGSTPNNQFIQYGRPEEAASNPRLSVMPPTQDAGFFPYDTPADALKTILQPGHNTTQDSPTLSHNELHHSQIPLDQEAQQTPTTNTFSFYAGLHGIPTNSALQHDNASSEVDRIFSSVGRTAPRLGRGLTKKSKDTTSPPSLNRGSDSTTQTSNILQRKRTPSVEITDQRPRQRLRSEDSRVKTPPLNDKAKIKSEDEVDPFNGFRPAEQGRQITFGVIDEFNAAPPLTRPQRPDEESNNFNPAPHPVQQWQPPAARTSRRQPPPTIGRSADYLKNSGRQIDENYSEDDEETPQAQQHRHRRQVTGTPALVAEATKNTHEIDQVAPRPARPRKPQGSYRTPEYKPLSPAERQDLEKRFCCQVAKIIGSKICVNKPPMPFDNVRIFDRLRERLLGKNFGDAGDGDGEAGKLARFSRWTPAQMYAFWLITFLQETTTTRRNTERPPTSRTTRGGCYKIMSSWAVARGVLLRLLVCYVFAVLISHTTSIRSASFHPLHVCPNYS